MGECSDGLLVACFYDCVLDCSYKRVKGRFHTVERRISTNPHKPHATSQPSWFGSHTRTDSAQTHRETSTATNRAPLCAALFLRAVASPFHSFVTYIYVDKKARRWAMLPAAPIPASTNTMAGLS